MIPRYSRKLIENIWTTENKFKLWTKIECLIAEKLAINGTIPKKAAKEIKSKAKFNIKEINKIEKKTKHDVVAYIQNVSKNIGESSKYFHYGVTSSDIIDTAFSIQLRDATDIIIDDIKLILKELKIKAVKYKNVQMIGRSHGIHAEPMTFGLKMASFYFEFKRNLERLKSAKEEISVCAISGPVGNYSSIDPSVENYVSKKLKLKSEKVSTQIIPRDRHAFFFATLGIIGSSIERISTEIRHLHKTEVLEVEEYFDKKQKGSSAMPHKRNPVLSENLTGLARYIRSGVIPSMENISLWHERDISHSSVERIFAPDITIISDFALNRLLRLLKNLIIYPKNMKKNLNFLGGLDKSQTILLKLIKNGLSRNEAYEIIQSASKKTWNTNKKFELILQNDLKLKKYIKKDELRKIFNNKNKNKNINYIIKKVIKDKI